MPLNNGYTPQNEICRKCLILYSTYWTLCWMLLSPLTHAVLMSRPLSSFRQNRFTRKIYGEAQLSLFHTAAVGLYRRWCQRLFWHENNRAVKYIYTHTRTLCISCIYIEFLLQFVQFSYRYCYRFNRVLFILQFLNIARAEIAVTINQYAKLKLAGLWLIWKILSLYIF